MKVLPWFLLIVTCCLLMGRDRTMSETNAAAMLANPLEAPGYTVVDLARRGVIAPTTLQPVVEILVTPGTRVKKGQVLIRLDSSAPQADLQLKKASLDAAEVALKEAHRHLAQIEKLSNQGTTPEDPLGEREHRLYESRSLAAEAEADERAARAALATAQINVDGCELRAPIDGVVASLKASPGSIVRPGTEAWGEILDLREIDVRCDLAPVYANRIKLGEEAEVRSDGHVVSTGKVTMIAVVADRATGLVPVYVRLANPQERIRVNLPMQVRFLDTPK
jgi:RND family efflux transporter MFP subunit